MVRGKPPLLNNVDTDLTTRSYYGEKSPARMESKLPFLYRITHEIREFDFHEIYITFFCDV